MERLCWACTFEREGQRMAGANDFAGLLANSGEPYRWDLCTGCGLHLLDNRGRKMCKTRGESDPMGYGDEMVGCALCHEFQRRQFARERAFRNRLPWLPHEDAALAAMVQIGRSNEQIGAALFRSPFQIKSRLVHLGLTRWDIKKTAWFRITQPWSAEDDQRLLAMTKDKEPVEQIAWKLNRTVRQINVRLDKLKKGKILHKRSEYARTAAPFTPADLKLMTEMAKAGHNNVQIGAALGRTPDAINRMFTKIGNPRGEDYCLFCGEPLEHEKRRGKKRKYCSDICCYEYYFAVRRGEVKRGIPAWADDPNPDPPAPKPDHPRVKIAKTRCKQCRKRPVEPGCEFCDDLCRRTAHRARKRQQKRQEQERAQVSR